MNKFYVKQIVFIQETLMIMENFYLVLIKNNGDIIHDVFATSHKDLIGKYISFGDKKDSYFKATFLPKDRLDDVNNYTLYINEIYIPNWYKGEFEINIISKLQNIISSMIIKGRKTILLH